MRKAWAILLLCGWQGREAQAQLSGSAALVSDHVYRGVSLSDGGPAPQLNLNYDGADGWYVGGFASRYKLQGNPRSGTQYIAYAGYAQRLSSGLTLDTGLSRYGYTPGASLNYSEVYASLALDNLNARLSYSPDYLGANARSAYLELNSSHALGAGVSLYLHGGYLGYLSPVSSYTRRRTLDGRVGLGTAWEGWRWQVAYAMTQARRSGYAWSYGGASGSRGSLVLSATRPF
ncbi:TorF family putative porin [Pseudoduganella sp. LjRoot289]|uniref:TorF family putative porin n=1 Tax=Pseudoduganella sp. LjRoot289 TaxID=3342314 RepID=UPI003ECFC346